MRYILSLLLILIAFEAHAFSTAIQAVLAGGGVSCSRGTVKMTENFENMADGEDWDNDGNWVDVDAITDIFEGDTAVKYAGNVSGIINPTGSDTSRIYYYGFTDVTSGYIMAEFWIRTNATNQFGTLFGLANNATRVADVIFFNDGYIKYYSNAAWTSMQTYSVDTWYKVEMRVNVDTSDGVGAVYVWIDGTEYGPYDTYARSNPNPIKSFYTMQYDTATSSKWIDNITVYLGNRCNP